MGIKSTLYIAARAAHLALLLWLARLMEERGRLRLMYLNITLRLRLMYLNITLRLRLMNLNITLRLRLMYLKS